MEERLDERGEVMSVYPRGPSFGQQGEHGGVDDLDKPRDQRLGEKGE